MLGVYTRVYIPTIPSWVYHHTTMPTTGTTVSMLVHTLPADGALGSNL